MTKIYVPNKHPEHDFSKALQYGSELVFLTEGPINRFNVAKLKSHIHTGLAESTPSDRWLVSSLTILNIIGTAYLIQKHNTVNLLLLKNNSYIERSI